MTRLVEETPCEHKDEYGPCAVQLCDNYNHTHKRGEGCFCPGGSRRIIEVDYIAARDWLKHKHGESLSLDDAKAAVLAALGGQEVR